MQYSTESAFNFARKFSKDNWRTEKPAQPWIEFALVEFKSQLIKPISKNNSLIEVDSVESRVMCASELNVSGGSMVQHCSGSSSPQRKETSQANFIDDCSYGGISFRVLSVCRFSHAPLVYWHWGAMIHVRAYPCWLMDSLYTVITHKKHHG